MQTRTLTISLLAMLLLAPAANASHTGPLIIQVVNDVFDDVVVDDITLVPGCSGGEFDELPESNGFRFYEVTEGARDADQESPTGGYESTGCGEARYNIEIPQGIDHFHVRFNASRTIDQFELNSGLDAEQTLLIEAENGDVLARRNYIESTEGSSEEQFYDPPSFSLPGISNVSVVWRFEDHGVGSSQLPGSLSGTSFEATVTDISIEYSYVPVVSSVVEQSSQAANDLVVEAIAVSTLDQEMFDTFDRINVRVQTQGTPSLGYVQLPDGTKIDSAITRVTGGDGGYVPNEVLLEQYSGYSWFTVPYGIVEEQGPGEYIFVIQESQGLVLVNGLIPVAAFIATLPLVASAFAVYGTARFRRESFGGYRRAATWLVIAIVILLAYYLAVMISGLITGTVQRMAVLPLDAAAWLLYAQVTFAAAGFIVVFVVGRELYRITVPRKPS